MEAGFVIVGRDVFLPRMRFRAVDSLGRVELIKGLGV